MPRITYGTLVPDVVTTVEVRASGSVEIINLDGSAEIYFRTDGEDPVVAGDNSDVVLAAMGSVVTKSRIWDVRGDNVPITEVRLISDGSPRFGVAAR